MVSLSVNSCLSFFRIIRCFFFLSLSCCLCWCCFPLCCYLQISATAVISLIYVQPPKQNTKKTIKTVQMSQLLFSCYYFFFLPLPTLYTIHQHNWLAVDFIIFRVGQGRQIMVWLGLCKYNLLWHGLKNAGRWGEEEISVNSTVPNRQQQTEFGLFQWIPPIKH